MMVVRRRGHRGFTLIELMVVIVVLGVLMATALPTYQGYAMKLKRSQGQTKLVEILQKEERFFTQSNTYTTTLGSGGLGYTTLTGGSTTVVIPLGSSGNELTTIPSGNYYQITAAACTGFTIVQCVQLTATPGGTSSWTTWAASNGGTLTINTLNQKSGTWN